MIERTVTISLDEYNELRDFKEKITNDNCAIVYCGSIWGSVRYYSTDDVIREVAMTNKMLKCWHEDEIQKKDDELNRLRQLSSE